MTTTEDNWRSDNWTSTRDWVRKNEAILGIAIQKGNTKAPTILKDVSGQTIQVTILPATTSIPQIFGNENFY